MNKLSIKNIIEFKNKKTEGSKRNFLASLNKEKIEKEDTDNDGGDYWVSSTSAISNAYRQNKSQLIKDKIKEIHGKLDNEQRSQIKLMYEQNILLLNKYLEYNAGPSVPTGKVRYHSKPNVDSILTFKGLKVQALPHHVFSFGDKEIGAIWFVAKKKGFTRDELGMFTDILYIYIKKNHATDYHINNEYCLAVDVVELFDITYSQIKSGEVKQILTQTLNEILRLT